MAIDCVATLDAGTGSGRCVVYDVAGRPLASAQETFEYRIFADPNFPLMRGFDIDAAAFWGSLARCARSALRQLPGDARLRGVVATSQREGCAFLDRAGQVLYAGPNLDARAAVEGIELQEHVSLARLHAITGHSPPYIFPVARYLWFRKHRDASQVATLLMLNDWITFELSGERVAEHSNAGESMLYDVVSRAWSDEILTALDIPAGILPPVCATGARVGSVTAQAARATGIPEGTPVFAGGADTQSALLGSGVHEVGQTGVVIGTTCPVQMVTRRPILDPDGNLWTSCHVVADRWVLESNGGDTGGAYRWLLELLFGSADPGAHAAAETAVAATGTSRPVICYLGPVVFNLKDANPFHPAGLIFRFPLLHIDRPSRGEILRGFLENVAFAIRGNCEQITAVGGDPVTALWASGGMVQSPTLIRIVADAVQVPIHVASVPESASLGCAILAAVGSGLHPSVRDAVHAMVRSRQVDPNPARAGEYGHGYQKWNEVAAHLHPWTL